MRNREAFSVVEVLVALIVFSVSALGSAAALGLSARFQREAVARRESINALELRLAPLILMPCDSIATSAAATTVSGIVVHTRMSRNDSLAMVTVSTLHNGIPSSLHTEVAC
jgi:Tfp pilus assembly protein PilV